LTKTKGDKFILIGVGGSYASLMDQGISPLAYSGAGGAAQLAFHSDTKRAINQAFLRFDFNILESAISGATIYSYQTTGAYQYYIKNWAINTGKWAWLPGMVLDFNWALRDHTSFTNNSVHLDTRIAFSPAINVSRDFKLWKRDFQAGANTSVPFLAYISRPLFASTQFPGTINKEEPQWFNYLSDGVIYSLGKNFRINMQSYLCYNFKNGNGLRLDYYWHYNRLEVPNAIKNAGHALLITTVLKL
jgi:hypothetical protein